MKRRMRKVTALVLSVGMMLSMTITSGAVTIDEAQKKADELQSQKSAAQAEKDTLAEKLNSNSHYQPNRQQIDIYISNRKECNDILQNTKLLHNIYYSLVKKEI